MFEKCPKCQSRNVYYSRKKSIWICEDCEYEFNDYESEDVPACNVDLLSDIYWQADIWKFAPRSLAFSYWQLHEYLENKNIGCALFLIRDVFELMIKVPVTIVFNGIHETIKKESNVTNWKYEYPKLMKLYEYSMQMLSTGKWWECVRLIIGIGEKGVLQIAVDDKSAELYSDTVNLLRVLYKQLYFKTLNNQTVSMVTWRNRTLGHSCLADNPTEQYREIPSILKMFQSVGETIVAFYKKVCLTNKDKIPLRGIDAVTAENEVYIQYSNTEKGINQYIKIHSFAACRNNSLSYFDGYEKGKAYLLDYGNGERYRDQHLSKMLFQCQAQLKAERTQDYLSNDDVYSDNLEAQDINSLEEKLLTKDEIIGICFLGKWLIRAIEENNKGLLLLTAERGLGKSTFCGSLNPFENLNMVFNDELYHDELEDFLSRTAVRVWHFNSEYRSRKDIFIPGIRDALLTLQPESGNRV